MHMFTKSVFMLILCLLWTPIAWGETGNSSSFSPLEIDLSVPFLDVDDTAVASEMQNSHPDSQLLAQGNKFKNPKHALPPHNNGIPQVKVQDDRPEPKPIKSIHYLGNFPNDQNNGWSEGLQGVANDQHHWFFTQKGRLWKFPIAHNLSTKITRITNDELSKGIRSVSIPEVLEKKGYDHFGDLDYFDGYLFIPLEGKKLTPRIAVFRSNNLWYIGSFLLPKQKQAGWSAIHPITKQLYTSNNSISPTDSLFVYSFDWGQVKTALDSSASKVRDHRCDSIGPKQVAFYKDKDYQGACSLRDAGSYHNSGRIGVTNDSISSIKVGNQAEVMVCRDKNMGGYCETITESIAYLKHGGQNPGLLNNNISSAIVSRIFSWKSSPQRKVLFDGQGQKKLTIKAYLQGGDFSAYGEELYIVNGKGNGFDPKDGGIWVFSGNRHRLIERSSMGGKFKFEFHPGASKQELGQYLVDPVSGTKYLNDLGKGGKRWQEPEGITIWNIPKGKAPQIPGSHVHVILLSPVYQWYFKHYEVIREK